MRGMGPRKYAPLRDYLAGQPPTIDALTLTFAQIEALIGGPLPVTAQTRQFWVNRRRAWDASSQARAWHDAGWRVAAVSLAHPGTVTFARLPSR